jgi:hypothetical protein
MKFISMLRAAAFMLIALGFVNDASATGTCSVTNLTLSGIYSTATGLSIPGTASWTCFRSSNGTDSTPSIFNVMPNAGGAYSAPTRRVKYIGTSTVYMPYALSTGTAAIWGDSAAVSNATAHVVSAPFSGNGLNSSGSFPFTLNIAAALNPFGGVVYQDSVSIGGTCSMNKNPTTNLCTVTPAATLSITVTTPVACTISSLIGAVLTFDYTSFQPSPSTATVQFDANCTNNTPFRMSVSPNFGTLLGLTYTIKLGTTLGSATDISSTTTYNLSGSGSAITYYINGTIPSGRGGDCSTGSCSATTTPAQAPTLQLDY